MGGDVGKTGGVESVAVLADLHGNSVALGAVLAEVERRGIERLVVAGDVAWGPDPRAVVDRVQALGDRVTVIRGNADREVADPARVAGTELAASTAWCASRLTPEQRRWLAELPVTAVIVVAGLGEVLVCHGSPRSDEEAMRPDLDPDATTLLLAGEASPVVVCGHTHVPFDVALPGHRMVNPGSVGLHYGQAGARWAVLGPDGVELVETVYDREAAARTVLASDNPDREDFAAFLRDPLGV